MLNFMQHAVVYILALVFLCILAFSGFSALKALVKSGAVAACLALAIGVGVAYLVINATRGPALAESVKKEVEKGSTKVTIPSVDSGGFGK